MNKRVSFALLLILLLGLALSVGAQDEPVTIIFWDNQQTESGLSEFQRIAAEEFEALTGIRVQIETIPYGDYQQRLLLAVQAGEPPDISTVDQIWNSGFAVADAIEPLDERIAASDKIAQENFFPGAWESATFDGQVWGIPFNVDVWQFTFYNQDLLDAAEVDPESLTTWEGLRATGEALTDRGNGQFGIGLFSHRGEDTIVVMNSFVYSNGGSVLHEDGSCALDEPEALEAIEFLVSLQPFAPEGILNASSGDMRELFLNGSLATEWWPALEQPTLLNSDLNWDFVIGTAPEGETPVGTFGGWNLVIYKDSQHKDEVWQFIEFLTDPEVNGRVVDLIPANIEAADSFLAENRRGPEKIIEHLQNARPRPLSPNYLQVSDIQQTMMQNIFSGMSVAEAVAAACAEINELNAVE